MTWRDFPKLELHLHLEGAAPPDLVRELGAEKGIDLSGVFDAAGDYLSNDFTSFLAAYQHVATVFQQPEDYRRLIEAVLAECAANGVIYAEIFLSPTSFGYDAATWRDYLAAIEAGADAAEARFGIICRFIPVLIRHHGPDPAPDAVRAVLGAPRGRMTGFGIAGDERLHHPADFARAFAEAGEAGLRRTAHAGEFGGAESVAAALDHLQVERVGHGVRAIEDPDLVARIAAEGVTLETCPGSNVSLGVYPDLASHPVARLRAAGARVTVSTDDPPFFHTTMTKEYDALAATFGFGAADFVDLAHTALNAAFCAPDVKAGLKKRLNDAGVAPAVGS